MAALSCAHLSQRLYLPAQMNFAGYGPSAIHAKNHTMGIKGIDAEIRLQDDAVRFEQLG